MEIVKKFKWLLLAGLVIAAGVFFLLNRFNRDVSAIHTFSASYEKFDKAVSDFSLSIFASIPEGGPSADDLEKQADGALVELNAKASPRISSLIKHDAEFMSTALEIVDISGKELDALRACKDAKRDKREGDADRLAREFSDLKIERTAAYARFQDLVELTK